MFRALQATRRLTGFSHPTRQFTRTATWNISNTKDVNSINTSAEEDLYEDENLLKDKQTRENLHTAYKERSADAIRYEYFAQRAELESEIEAASLLRSMTETAKQQSMGYLELMEEYGDAEFGSTVDNLDVAAQLERNNSEKIFKENSAIAAQEDLEHIEEWFEDMAIASEKAAARLELVSSMLEAEGLDDMLEDEDDESDDKLKG